jgi:hypothetical protein
MVERLSPESLKRDSTAATKQEGDVSPKRKIFSPRSAKGVQQPQQLSCLTPECGFVATQTFERAVVNFGKAKKSARQSRVFTVRAINGSVKRALSPILRVDFGRGSDILHFSVETICHPPTERTGQ